MVEITVNGDAKRIQDAITITQLLELFNIHERLVVVEHNGEIVPRDEFGNTPIAAGDNIEVVQMMAGG